MIWLHRPLGTPFALALAGLGPIEGAQVRAAARDSAGAIWPLPVEVLDAAAGRIRVDFAAVGRSWPAGLYVTDVRLERLDLRAITRTVGIAMLDADGWAEAARRLLARSLRPGQRRVWSHEGEALDALCRRAGGREADVALAYALNPGLPMLGPLLPAGVGVVLPEVSDAPAAPRRPLRLWGAP